MSGITNEQLSDVFKSKIFTRPNIYTDPKIPTSTIETKIRTSINDSFIGQPEFDFNNRDLGPTINTKCFGTSFSYLNCIKSENDTNPEPAPAVSDKYSEDSILSWLEDARFKYFNLDSIRDVLKFVAIILILKCIEPYIIQLIDQIKISLSTLPIMDRIVEVIPPIIALICVLVSRLGKDGYLKK